MLLGCVEVFTAMDVGVCGMFRGWGGGVRRDMRAVFWGDIGDGGKGFIRIV